MDKIVRYVEAKWLRSYRVRLMTDERIHILRDILLELHNGASPESVQERFDATFTGVSAIEISLMEHELMNSDSGVYL